MLLLEALNDPARFLALVVALVGGLTIHEYAHARTAFQLGDLTAYMQGRLTLDPRRHIDPFGALVFLMVGFGWARPVPIDPYRLDRMGTLLVSVAGPLSNLALAAVAGLPLRFGVFGLGTVVGGFLFFFAYLNILLAVFNMLPIPPLDGWKVLLGLVPASTAFQLQQLERYAWLALLLLVFLLPGVLWGVLNLFRCPLQLLLTGYGCA
jgi:Zn-dependent protease